MGNKAAAGDRLPGTIVGADLLIRPRDCQKTSLKMSGTEQRGVCAGGKKPTARSINRILKLFESFKIRTAGRKYFFDTLRWSQAFA